MCYFDKLLCLSARARALFHGCLVSWMLMYQEFYNFSAEPFRLSPDHDFAYTHKGYTKAQAYMKYAFMRAEGFVMITGRPGTGKTTLVGDLLNELADTSVSIANLVCTQVKANDLLKLVA